MHTPPVQNNPSPQVSTSPTVSSVQSGDVVHGKVVKWHPNQLAEVQIGNKVVLAKMDVPLEVGKANWFQVEIKEGTMVLKVLPTQSEVTTKPSIDQLLQALQLPGDKLMKQLVSLWIQNDKAINKHSLQIAYETLKGTKGATEWGNALRDLLQSSKPITPVSIQTARALHDQTTLSSLLLQLSDRLGSSKGTKTVDLLQANLHLLKAATNGLPKDSLQHFPHKVVTEIVDSSSKVGVQLVDWLRTKAGVSPAVTRENAALTLAQGIIQATMPKDVASALQTLTRNAMNMPVSQEWSTLLQQSSEAKVTTFPVEKFLSGNMTHGEATKQLALAQLQNSFPQNATNSKLLSTVMKDAFSTSQSIPSLLAQLILTANSGEALPSTLSKWVVETTGQQSFLPEQAPKSPLLALLSKLIGTDLESQLAHPHTTQAILEDQLKPNLVKLIAETTSPAMKELAESIIGKIQAGPLFSGEVGPQQHITMNLPLLFQETPIDLSLKWEGKKLPDGTIDPDFCRILFYLDLPKLQATTIDMNVQQRVINITIYTNEAEQAKVLSEPLTEKIKAGLSAISYTLSSLQWKPKESEISMKGRFEGPTISSYQGVDIRI